MTLMRSLGLRVLLPLRLRHDPTRGSTLSHLFRITTPSLSLFQPVRTFHQSPTTRHGSVSYSHRDTPDNNPSTPFDFTEHNYLEVNKILSKYPENYKKSAVIPLLHLAQKQHGWVPLAAMNKIAKILEIENIYVYEVATFYTMFHRHKVGKHLVCVCTTTPCMLRNGYELLEWVKSHLNIDVGETTEDGLFTLEEVECLGACVNAPMLSIDDEYFEDLTEETIKKVLDAYKRGEKPKVGPQVRDRFTCEPAGGRTTLLEPPPGPYCREL